MKSLISIAALSIALAACSGDEGNGSSAATAVSESDVTVTTPVEAPADGDWSKVSAKTSAGGYLMGNPDAAIKLVEFGSMTCGACAAFEVGSSEDLINGYVKDGSVSWEFRNYIRDPFDLTAALVARCGGESTFWPMTKGLFADQRNWLGKASSMDPQQAASLEQMGTGERFKAMAKIVGLYDFAALRGISAERLDACLADEAEASRLVDLTSAANDTYPIPGTPSFVINGDFVPMENGKSFWDQLKAAIDARK